MLSNQDADDIRDGRIVFIDDLELPEDYSIDFTEYSDLDSGGSVGEDYTTEEVIEDSYDSNTGSRDVESWYVDDGYSSDFETSGESEYDADYSERLSEYDSESEFYNSTETDDDEEYYFIDDLDVYNNVEDYWDGYTELPPSDPGSLLLADGSMASALSVDEGDPDLIVLESRDTTEPYPRITRELVAIVLIRMYMAYNLGVYDVVPLTDTLNTRLYSEVKIADRIRDFTAEELEYLKAKVSSILVKEIRDAASVRSLVELINVDKIDNIDNLSFQRTRFVSTLFRDLKNVDGTSCGICYSEFQPTHKCTSLLCLHTFHTKCIKKWVGVSWCCPLCRRKDIG